jgi:pimeloyl-ACP methyl ester carboxylesterase
MHNPVIYLISGLGADLRLFKKLVFPAGFDIVYIDWISPIHSESIYDYAKRLSAAIDTKRTFYIVGISFGGMVASELTRIVKPRATIIISSASSSKEIPWYYKLAGSLKLTQIVPLKAVKTVTPFTYWFFGADSEEEKSLLRSFITNSDGQFLRWAFNAIATWRTSGKPKNLYHIHGESDKVLPAKFTEADVSIRNAEHLMVLSEHEKVSAYIEQICRTHN